MEKTLDILMQTLKSSDSQNRSDALFRIVNENLSQLADDDLNLMKKERNNDLKGRCAWALGRLYHTESYPFLIHNLYSPSSTVRKWSAWALGALELQRAAKHLHEAMEKEREDDVRQAIGGALRRLSGKNVRVHTSQVQNELNSLKLPFTRDLAIGKIVNRLEKLQWPRDKEEILRLRDQMKSRDPSFYRSYKKWALGRPALLNSMEDDTIVFS